ncbi:MAG: NUDIX pyrophosphatase [Candidatus Bathyarchaeia archaeon]
MRLPIQIEAILFKRTDGKIQYLLLRRYCLKRYPEMGGFWQPVSGGLEEGETKIEALEREIREETGIKNIIKIIENVHYYEFLNPHLVKEYVFGVEVSSDEKVVLDGKEHSEFKWCSFQEALKLMKWKGNRDALKKLDSILSHI